MGRAPDPGDIRPARPEGNYRFILIKDTFKLVPLSEEFYKFNSQGLNTYFTIDLSLFNIYRSFQIELLVMLQWRSKNIIKDIHLYFDDYLNPVYPTHHYAIRNDLGVFSNYSCFAVLDVPLETLVNRCIIILERQGGPEYNVLITGYLKVTKNYTTSASTQSLVVCSDDFGESSEPFEVVGYQTD